MPKEEYYTRRDEVKRYAALKQIPFLEGEYDNENWLKFIKGYEQENEGGMRCCLCYQFRLHRTAAEAKSRGFDAFSTTLTISPHKNSSIINQIGKDIEKEFAITFIEADLKKKDGFRKSMELSKKHNIFRQDYCGCVFSMESRNKSIASPKL